LPAAVFFAGLSVAVCAIAPAQIEIAANSTANAGTFLDELMGCLLFTGIFQTGAGSIVGDRWECPLKK
jgi:hypothetical protein